MSRGFIFSIDALFAVFILLSAAVSVMALGVEKPGADQDLLRLKARDQAMVGSYAAQPAVNYSASNWQGACDQSYSYNPASKKIDFVQYCYEVPR